MSEKQVGNRICWRGWSPLSQLAGESLKEFRARVEAGVGIRPLGIGSTGPAVNQPGCAESGLGTLAA